MAGLAGSVAATSLAQTMGSEVDRAQQATGNQDRRVRNEQRAESAAGIGEADGDDHQTDQRDADGRRPWEMPERAASPSEPSSGPRMSKDASHQSGNLIDLTG
jgi:hypothetical protein